MSKPFARQLHEKFGAVTTGQKLGVSAIVMGILMEPMNKTGFTWDRLEEVEAVVYGAKPSLAIRLVTCAAEGACNEVIDEVAKELKKSESSLCRELWGFLNGKEIVPGVCYNR